MHVRQESVEGSRTPALSLDRQRTGGKLQRPAAVGFVAAVLGVQDARRTDHRVPREVELFNQVEDACSPIVLRPSWVEEDGLELSQLGGDLGHLCGAEAVCVGKDSQAVATVGRRGEHINELELHRYHGTAPRGEFDSVGPGLRRRSGVSVIETAPDEVQSGMLWFGALRQPSPGGWQPMRLISCIG